MSDLGDTEGRVRVVVVDDQAPFRRAAASVVNRTPGFVVVDTGESGERAVELCQALHPDLLLLDVQMPGIGGLVAARQVQALTGTTVVLVSTHRREDLDLDTGALFLAKEELTPTSLQQLWASRTA